jgi:hypothetical protein
VSEVSIGSLLAPDGESLVDMDRVEKRWGDAEGIASVNGDDPWQDGVFVSFEREHRVWKYPAGSNGTIALLPEAPLPGIGDQDNEMKRECTYNGGLEALEMVRGDPGAGKAQGLLFMCEDVSPGPAEGSSNSFGAASAWIARGVTTSQGGGGGSSPILSRLRYLVRDGILPVAAASIPNGSGDILVLERNYVAGVGNTLRVRHIQGSSIEASEDTGCVMSGSLAGELNPRWHFTDNFEGMSVLPLQQ